MYCDDLINILGFYKTRQHLIICSLISYNTSLLLVMLWWPVSRFAESSVESSDNLQNSMILSIFSRSSVSSDDPGIFWWFPESSTCLRILWSSEFSDVPLNLPSSPFLTILRIFWHFSGSSNKTQHLMIFKIIW